MPRCRFALFGGGLARFFGNDSGNFLSVLFFVMDVALFFSHVPFGCVWGLFFDGEFDPGSGRTLAACLTHASRTDIDVRP